MSTKGKKMSHNIMIAEAYYKAMGEKNIAEVGKYLHPDVQFVAPLGKMSGKETMLEGAKKFMNVFKALTIRSKFAAADQAMVVYDLECPQPIGSFSTAVLMSFQEGLISKIELFFDARPFESKKT